MKVEDLKTDIKILVDCIVCQQESPNAMERALKTLTEILVNDYESQDVMRELGALKFVVELMMSARHTHIRSVSMCCVAHCVFGNSQNQTEVATWEVFSFLHQLLLEPARLSRAVQPVLFLLLALIANNETGQTLLRKSDCLTRLLHLIQEFLRNVTDHSWLEDVERSADDLTLGKALVAVLTSCVNNPQNDENQRECATLFPQAFRVIEGCKEISVSIALASLIGQTTANNIHNQNRVEKCGGLEVLTSALHRAVNRARLDSGQLNLATSLVVAINTLISDHMRNCLQFGDLGGIPLLLQLLQMEGLKDADKLQVVLTLGHCTYNSTENQEIVVSNEGLNILIQSLPNSENEELSKAIRFVLKACVKTDQGWVPKKQVLMGDFDIPQQSDSVRDEEFINKLNALEHELEQSPGEPSRLFRNSQLSSEDLCTMKDAVKYETPLILQMAAHILKESNPDSVDALKRNLGKERRVSDLVTPLMTPAVTSVSQARKIQDLHEQEDPKLKHVKVETCENKQDSDRLKDELIQEREEKALLCAEVARIRAVLEEQSRQEAETGKRAELLLAELERQQQEEEREDTDLHRQVEESVRQYEELSRLKQEKEDELQTIEQRLENLKSFAEQSGIELTSPISHCSSSQVLGNSLSWQHSKHPLNSTELEHNLDTEGNLTANDLSEVKMQNNSAIFKTQTQKKGDFVFVRPKTPEKSQNQRRKSITQSSSSLRNQKSFTSFNAKPQGQGDHNQTVKSPYSVTPASPCLSEFDLELLQIARSHNTFVKKVKTPKLMQKLPTHMASTPMANTRVKHSSRTLSVKKITDIKSVIGLYPNTPQAVRIARKREDCKNLDKIRKNLCETEFIENDPHEARLLGSENSDTKIRANERIVLVEGGIKDAFTGVYNRENTKELPKQSLHSIQNSGRRSCPACDPPESSGLPLLHSRNYNIALETGPHTCALHREVRMAERNFILQLKRLGKITKMCRDNKRIITEVKLPTAEKQTNVYDFHSSASLSSDALLVSPPLSENSDSGDDNTWCSISKDLLKVRKERIPYSKQEEFNLKHGVQHLGRFWNQILNTYDFHPSRTAVDLKDKYRNMIKKEKSKSPASLNKQDVQSTRKAVPFSMAEERRLKRGVRLYGNNWTAILKHYRFYKGRTASSLRDKWRNMHK